MKLLQWKEAYTLQFFHTPALLFRLHPPLKQILLSNHLLFSSVRIDTFLKLPLSLSLPSQFLSSQTPSLSCSLSSSASTSLPAVISLFPFPIKNRGPKALFTALIWYMFHFPIRCCPLPVLSILPFSQLETPKTPMWLEHPP